MEEKRFKWRPMDIDLNAFMAFIRRMGAASINEIKHDFHTDSASVRKVVGYLYHHNRIWLLAHGRGIYVAENTGRKGSVDVTQLRKKAGVVKKPRQKMGASETFSRTRVENGQLKVGFVHPDEVAETWIPDEK